VFVSFPFYWQSEAPEEEKKRQEYKNYLRDVYHKVYGEIMKPIKDLENIGLAVECGDGKTRIFFPSIHILSMDFEEQ
jgi:hypothetical protein